MIAGKTIRRELTVVGTASQNASGGNRARTIQRYCWVGCPVIFQRQRAEPNAIGVYLVVPGFLFGKKLKCIGSVDSKAATWLGNMLDQDRPIHASVTNHWKPRETGAPVVTIGYEAARG